VSALLELYGRAGCCLCDDARERLEELAPQLGFALVERDIESDERLLRAYLERIPVIVLDGEELCDLRLDEGRLRARLEEIHG
jgi:glutaredoxin